jgi:1-acyl-sn-glycerol-3-phosphate acyltransferase
VSAGLDGDVGPGDVGPGDVGPGDVGPGDEGPGQQGEAPAAAHEHHRPLIEKSLADHEVLIPEGHHAGEVMTFGQKIVYAITWIVSTSIAKTYFRAKVKGHEHVPRTGAFIVSPVHRSNLDSPLIALVTRRRMRFMGKESLWKRGWSAWYFTAAGGFPVERATADRRALNACLEVVERGEPLVMFPEGTRQSGPVITEMFDGPAWLACRAQIPILPIGLGGTEAAMGKGTKFPRPVRMTVVIGEPIQPPARTDKGRVPRRAVHELSEELRSTLQDLFDEAQVLAGTPNPPRPEEPTPQEPTA